jgi:cellulose synthase/poly-beta-1,6-N-acetylglucosamine synthase-like glycosyltransferase
MVKHFQDPTVDALVGNVSIFNNVSIIGKIQELEYIFGFYFKRVHSFFDAEYIFGGACAAFRKATTFDKIGYFDEKHKTEDIEYSMRTQINGLKSVYAEDVVVYTEGASDLAGLLRQRTRWKKGRMDTFWKYRELFFSKNKNHNSFLSWIVLPYAFLGEVQLFLEPVFFAIIWSYTFISGDYLSVGLSSLFIFFTFFASLFLAHHKHRFYYILFFPAFSLLFYVLVAVEFFALLSSLELFLNKKDVTWQKWNRKGLHS